MALGIRFWFRVQGSRLWSGFGIEVDLDGQTTRTKTAVPQTLSTKMFFEQLLDF